MIIRKLRQDRGWSQEDLAELSGISVRTIQRNENGGRASLETLKCLAAVFETSIPELKKDRKMSDQEKTGGTPAKPVDMEDPAPQADEAVQLSEEDRAALRYVRNLKRYAEAGEQERDKGIHIRDECNGGDDDKLAPSLSYTQRHVLRQVRHERQFYRNLVAYVVIIGFLAVLNLLTNPHYLWFLWAAAGWGVALVLQAARVFGKQRWLGEDWERREVERRLERLAKHSARG